ncbi:hypothetical protein BDB00DRAFT_818090 [Zychaea mexicana]|uniref:uncharacterized protein n=1 Tax=Zychaea mexicana TaxID=64656 RepID=UPI0022FE2D2D|nr:uncharacterized protein BDB00DRAFT_818090 [Zychaea mexicana]KAI9494452.1 hypothetical protein BDB00DRAFT_818090 [Zychaea mexicana]
MILYSHTLKNSQSTLQPAKRTLTATLIKRYHALPKVGSRDVHTCMITPIDCAALGLSRPSWWLKLAYDTCWYLHGYYVRFLKFPRKESYLGTALLPTDHNVFMPQYPQAEHPDFPDGYTFATLGPSKIRSSPCPMPDMRVGTCPVAHAHEKE